MAGKEFFDSLDRDADGRVSLDDMRAAMRARNLPERYAQDFIRTARGGRWWSHSITCAPVGRAPGPMYCWNLAVQFLP